MAGFTERGECKLDYNLYACDFDPRDANTLVVGGGGGTTRSGIGNKITVLDASHRDSLQKASELELRKDEDSVNTLVVVSPRKGHMTLVLGGANSGNADVAKGKNEHFRVFGVDPPSSKAKAAGDAHRKIEELSRASLFKSKDVDTFQRLLRLSPEFEGSSRQVGAAATGLAKESEIVLFDVSTASGNPVKSRARVELKKEAMDLDIIQVGDDRWQLAYCDDHDIYTVDVGKNSVEEAKCIYTIPHDVATGAKTRPTFRGLRYLTPNFLLTALNLPKSTGVLLQGFRLPKTGQEKARIAVNERLNKVVGRATGMEVRNLSPPSSPSAKQGDTQFIIAVSGYPSSITLLTLEFQTVADIELIVNLHPIKTLKDVHGEAPVSCLAFSHFVPPENQSATRQCHLKLASLGSFGRTVVVQSIPLERFSDRHAPARRDGPPRPVRYVSALKSRGPSPTGLLVFIAVVVAIMAVVTQGFLEIKGISQPVIGAKYVTPVSWHNDWKARAAAVGKGGFLAEHIARLGDGTVVLNTDADGAGGVKVDSHDAERHAEAREWSALPVAQRKAWKDRLKEAGHWSESMGETVFKGILFGEMAGVVAAAVGG